MQRRTDAAVGARRQPLSPLPVLEHEPKVKAGSDCFLFFRQGPDCFLFLYGLVHFIHGTKQDLS